MTATRGRRIVLGPIPDPSREQIFLTFCLFYPEVIECCPDGIFNSAKDAPVTLVPCETIESLLTVNVHDSTNLRMQKEAITEHFHVNTWKRLWSNYQSYLILFTVLLIATFMDRFEYKIPLA